MRTDIDILLMNPPYERLKGFTLASVPNGILGLATYLEELGYKAAVWDADTNYDEGVLVYNNDNRANSQNNYAAALDNDDLYIWQEVRETIKNLNPDFVGITLMTPTLHSGLKVARIAKELGKTVIVGGPHVNIVQHAVLDYEEIDFAFFGEGEHSLPEFLKAYPDYDQLKDIKGLGYKREDDMVMNGFADRVKVLEDFPFPDRELLVYKERYLPRDLATIMASRGCPFKCTFCASVPIWGRNTIYRSPEHIVDEIRSLHDTYHTREFRFFDDTFTVNRKKLIQVCKLLVEEFGEKYFSWWCLSTIKSLDDEVLSWLRKAGCDQVHVGVETGSARIMDRIEKGCTKDEAREAILLAKKHKMWVGTFFITGFPFEEEADIRETMEFIKEIKPDSVNLCTFTPYPGTGLYDYCIEKGLLEHDPTYDLYKHIGHHSTSNFFMDTMTQEEYGKLRDELLVLTTEISEALNYRKFMYRLKNLTMEKVIRKLKVKTRKLSVIWKGPGHMLVQNAQMAETKRQSIDDGVGGLTLHTPSSGSS
jgi:anaerobic magnesium-protoporphyrin IX monomethyl ester cyclase